MKFLLSQVVALVLLTQLFYCVVAEHDEHEDDPVPKNCSINIDGQTIIVPPNMTLIFINKTCEAVVCNVTGGEFKVVRLTKLNNPEEPGTDCCTVDFGHQSNGTNGSHETIMVQQHAQFCDRRGCRRCNDKMTDVTSPPGGPPGWIPPGYYHPPVYPPPPIHPPPSNPYPPPPPGPPYPAPPAHPPYHPPPPVYPPPAPYPPYHPHPPLPECTPWGCRASNCTVQDCEASYHSRLPHTTDGDDRDDLEHERQTCHNVANKEKSCARAKNELKSICHDWVFKSHPRRCIQKCEEGASHIEEICLHQGFVIYDHQDNTYKCVWDHEHTQLFFKEPRELTKLFSECMTEFDNPHDSMMAHYGGGQCSYEAFVYCCFKPTDIH